MFKDIEFGGDVKLFVAYMNDIEAQDFGYIFAKTKEEAIEKATELIQRKWKENEIRYKNKIAGMKKSYKCYGTIEQVVGKYPDERDIDVIEITSEDIML